MYNLENLLIQTYCITTVYTTASRRRGLRNILRQNHPYGILLFLGTAKLYLQRDYSCHWFVLFVVCHHQVAIDSGRCPRSLPGMHSKLKSLHQQNQFRAEDAFFNTLNLNYFHRLTEVNLKASS